MITCFSINIDYRKFIVLNNYFILIRLQYTIWFVRNKDRLC